MPQPRTVIKVALRAADQVVAPEAARAELEVALAAEPVAVLAAERVAVLAVALVAAATNKRQSPSGLYFFGISFDHGRWPSPLQRMQRNSAAT